MFTRTDAAQLRDSLAAIEFSGAGSSSPLLQKYRDYYSLSFSSPERAVSHIVGTLFSNGFTIVCQYFFVPSALQKGTAFLLHGYFDHTGIYGHLIQHCLRQGYAVVIFDLPGHGVSSGPAASIDSFRRYSAAFMQCLAVAEEQGVNRPWISIGQSTGAAVIMDSILDRALTDRFSIEKFVLLGPLLRPHNWMAGRLLFNLSRRFLHSTPRTFTDHSHDREFIDFIRGNDALQSQRLPRDWVLAMIDYHKRFAGAGSVEQPLHVIQGSGDDTVDWQYNLPQIMAKFTGSQTYMVTDARHHLVNESPEYRERIFTIIDKVIES